MVKKILLLFILFNISFEQSDLNIEILGGEQSPKCANEMGRLEFSSKYTSSSEDEINSYFLLNFKDKSNKKRFSICQLSTSKNSSSSSEIDPSQPGENEYDPDDAELKSLLGNIRLKFQGRLNKLLDSREELKKLAKHSANIVNYQIVTQSEKINLQNIKNKFNGSLSGLNKLIELGSGNLTEKIANFNISEAKDKLNSSICTLKKKIVEMSGKQDLLQLLNMSKIVNGVSALLSGAKNTTELNKKVVNGIDTILTKFNLYTILSLGYLEEKMKTNLGTTNLKEAVDKIKTNLANNTKLNNLKNMSFSKINETLYDVPNIIQDKIDKKEPLIIFDKIVGYLNNSNISDSIHKMISSFEGLENIISSKNGTNVKEIFNNMLNSTKTKINSLNSTLLNNIVSKIGESNDKIIQKLKENGVPELFQNITNKLNELKNKIKDRAQNISFDEIGEIIKNSIDKVKKANATEVTNKILDQIEVNKKIISFLKNESEFLNKYKSNITEHLKDYIENNDQLNSLIEKIKNNNNQIKESLITPDIINEMEELKTYKDKIKQNLNDIKTEEQSKFNQTLYNLIDKLIKINYTGIIANLSNTNTQYKQKMKEISQSLSKTNLSSIIPGIRQMINDGMNSYDKTKFSNAYYGQLSKINNIQKNLSSSINSTRLNEIKFSLSNINSLLKNITVQIKDNLIKANITSGLKDNLQTAYEGLKSRTNNFHKDEISEIITQIKNTTFYHNLEPTLNQLNTKRSEFISKFNTTQITDELKKVYSYIKNNQTEIMENINNKMGQIDLANMKTQLNESLAKIKSNIINEISNKTKMDERKSEFMMNVKNGLNKVKNLINYTEIMKNVNNSLANNVIGKQILEKVQNYSYYLNLLKNNIDMSKIVNSTRINGILSDIKTDMEKVPGKMKSKLQELNESLYTCDNEFIANKNFDLSNLQKNIDDTNNKLKTAKIGDLKGIFTDFSSMLLQDLKNKTKGINENSHFIALMKELNATLNKAKTEIMTQITTNAEFKPLLEDLNNKKNSLNQTFEEIKSSAIITSLKNRTNLTLEKIYNTKLSDIKEYSDKTKSKIKEEYNNIAKIEKVSQKTKYILDKYIIENNKTQNIIGKVFNTTKINNNITQLISLIENVENYYGEFKTENGAKKYNESKEYLQQQIKDINTKENLNNLKETVTQDFNDTLNLIKLLQKKYESIPDKDNKTELTNRIKAILKEEQEKLNLTEKISENIDPRVKEFILKVSDKIMSLKDKIGIPDNKTELLNILKEKVNSTQNNVNGLIEDLKGKNVTEIGKYLSEKAQTTLKVSIKEGLKRILDSEKINNIQNNENVLKLVEKLNNNKVIGSQFAQIMLNFTLFIKNLNASVHRDDDSFYDGIKENVRNYWEKSNLKNNSELIKGMVENGLNLQEYKNIYTSVKSLIKEINNDIIGLMDELLNLFKNKKNNDKTKLRLLSINKNEINKRRIDTTGDLVCKIDDTFSEDETLTAEPENINSFVIKSNVDYNIKINSNINIKVDKNTVNNCGNNYTKYVSEKITFANISTLNKDNNKKRFNFKMRVRILRSFIIPDFFYLMMKVRLIIRLRNSRNLRNLDSEEEVPSFCLLEDDKNRDNSTFDCFGYNDNINENTNISIGNITSPYIEIPNNIFTTNEPGTNGTDPGENTDETRYHLSRSSKSSGLKGGAIAGIVIACVVVLALIIGLILFLRKRSNKPIPNPNPNSEETMKDLNFNFK